MQIEQRTLSHGAEVIPGGVHFRIWAPVRKTVHVIVMEPGETNASRHVLQAEGDGYFSAEVSAAKPGSWYWFEVDNDPARYPDPASRFQPQGVLGPSEVVDPSRYLWRDDDWPGVQLPGQVLYELHVGTFTPEGTWAAAIEKLDHLRDVGVTLIEVMPLAEFQGEFGWGYDGVCWYAPTRLYGQPDDFRAFVDAAHQRGIGVILDVVYNHFGPSGNFLGAFTPYFDSEKHATEWGKPINFDGEQSGPVREFVTGNAAYWIREFHLDGLRLDATQALFDDSPRHIITEIGLAARAAAGDRSILLFAENEDQRVQHVAPVEQGGYGLDGLWNDDFHHACRVAATGHAEFYYGDYHGSPQELVSAVLRGYLYQGQWNLRQQRFRGTSTRNIDRLHFVHFLQNHDQVANSALGLRLHDLSTPGRFRALTALLLLTPETPLLFMGQEFAASSPFLYFADHEVDVAEMVRQGRLEFLRRFSRVATFPPEELADPADRQTFEQSKLDWNDCRRHAAVLRLHRDLLALRHEDAVFARQQNTRLEGVVLGPEAFALRWWDDDEDDRLMLVNLGRDLDLRPMTEPLLAPVTDAMWELYWSSDAPRYGGSGTAMLNMKEWTLPGHAALVLRPACSARPARPAANDAEDR